MKILVIRFSSIGDIVLTSPVLRCIKTQLNNAEIHYLTKQHFVGLVENNPHVDKVWGLQSDFKSLVNELKKQRFDYVIDLHNNLRSKRIKLHLSASSAAINKLNIKKWLLVQLKKDVMPPVHIVDRYIATASKLGIKNDDHGLDFYIPSNTVLPDNLPSSFVCYAIGGQHATKKLPTNKIVELCDSIPKEIVIIGGKDDVEAGAEIEGACKRVTNLVGQLTINQSARVMEQADVVISHDTGMMHIAAALGKKILSIWGNTVPQFGMYPYRPHPDSKIFEISGLDCRPCSKIGYDACPKRHFNCMNQQPLTDIASHCQPQ